MERFLFIPPLLCIVWGLMLVLGGLRYRIKRMDEARRRSKKDKTPARYRRAYEVALISRGVFMAVVGAILLGAAIFAMRVAGS